MCSVGVDCYCTYICFNIIELIIMSTPQPNKEYTVFTDHYAQLCDTMVDVCNLLPYFVQEKLIKVGDLEEINAKERTKDKVIKLLHYIDGPLQAGSVECFYTLLRIMERHGTVSTAELANAMRGHVNAREDLSSTACSVGQFTHHALFQWSTITRKKTRHSELGIKYPLVYVSAGVFVFYLISC